MVFVMVRVTNFSLIWTKIADTTEIFLITFKIESQQL